MSANAGAAPAPSKGGGKGSKGPGDMLSMRDLNKTFRSATVAVSRMGQPIVREILIISSLKLILIN
jgi:hypothetical protein